MNFESYWTQRHPVIEKTYLGRASVRYAGGRMRNIAYSVDVRRFVAPAGDAVMRPTLAAIMGETIEQVLTRSSDKLARRVQAWVAASIQYRTDSQTRLMEDHWQPPEETLAVRAGDCEDGALLMLSLLLAAGIPSWRLRVAVGTVLWPSQGYQGHAWVAYCRGVDWVPLDWCFMPETDSRIAARYSLDQLTRHYTNTVWSFNDVHAYTHAADPNWAPPGDLEK